MSLVTTAVVAALNCDVSVISVKIRKLKFWNRSIYLICVVVRPENRFCVSLCNYGDQFVWRIRQ